MKNASRDRRLTVKSIVIFVVSLFLICGAAIAEEGDGKGKADDAASLQSKPGVRVQMHGSDCVSLARTKGLEGAERRKYIADCSRQFKSKVETSNSPEHAEERIAKSKYEDCKARTTALKGSKEWAADIKACLEPGNPTN
jgi:hypothetical protein